MPPMQAGHNATKRKDAGGNKNSSGPPTKKARQMPEEKGKSPLIGPHETIISQLRPKYDVLAASVISSTQIRKRVTQAIDHLSKPKGSLPALVLLYARTAEVCKMITIIEQCKRLLNEDGTTWVQYNQLFELPADARNSEVVEETVIDRNQAGSEDDDHDDDDDDDAFETMSSRFEKAVLPPQNERVPRSMRIFLSVQPVAELKADRDTTVQSSRDST